MPAAPDPEDEGPDINGVVRAVREVDGVRHATISVGSNDGVKKGMRFSVVDPDEGVWLGHLTIDAVGFNEATGSLAGPNVKAVKLGHRVMTKL